MKVVKQLARGSGTWEPAEEEVVPGPLVVLVDADGAVSGIYYRDGAIADSELVLVDLREATPAGLVMLLCELVSEHDFSWDHPVCQQIVSRLDANG